LPLYTARALVAIGVLAAGFSIFQAQRAWKGWPESSSAAAGVGLAAFLAMTAGVVGVALFAALSPVG
jgi:hypothetical protein